MGADVPLDMQQNRAYLHPANLHDANPVMKPHETILKSYENAPLWQMPENLIAFASPW